MSAPVLATNSLTDIRRGQNVIELYRFCHRVGYTLTDETFAISHQTVPLVEWTCELDPIPIISGTTTGTGATAALAWEHAASQAIALLKSAGLLEVQGARLRVRLEAFGYEPPKSRLSAILSGDVPDGIVPDVAVLADLKVLIATIQEASLPDESNGVLSASHLASLDKFCSENLLPIMPTLALESLDQILTCLVIGPHSSLLSLKPPSIKFGTCLLLLVLGICEGHQGRLSDIMQLSVTRTFELCLFIWHGDVTPQSSPLGFSNSVLCTVVYLQRLRYLPFISRGRFECWILQQSGWWEPYAPKQGAKSLVSWEVPEISLVIRRGFDSFNEEVILPTFGVKAEPYGSAVNGFGLPGSDIDALVMIADSGESNGENHNSNSESSAVLNLALKAEEKFPGLFKIEKVENARVPILVVKGFVNDSGAMVVGPTEHPIEINVSFNHPLVLVNSNLLARFSRLHPKLRQIIVAVKRWAKARGVGDALTGGLSSYSWTLLVIAHFQWYGILPIEDVPLSQDAIQIFDSTPVPEMLFRFFAFLHSEFDPYTLSAEITGKGRKPGSIEKKSLCSFRKLWLSILDPCEEGRVLGTSAKGFENVIAETRRALTLLLEDNAVEIFKPGKVGRNEKWWNFPRLAPPKFFEFFERRGKRCSRGGRQDELFQQFKSLGFTVEEAEENLRVMGFGRSKNGEKVLI